jgi:hypothetical protein
MYGPDEALNISIKYNNNPGTIQKISGYIDFVKPGFSLY